MSDFQPVAPFKVRSTQVVAYTGTAAASAAVSVGVNCVRLFATTAAFVAFGSAPVATANDLPLAANTAELFLISPNNKISAIQSAAPGNLFISEMTK